jgi:hypothetical protein
LRNEAQVSSITQNQLLNAAHTLRILLTEEYTNMMKVDTDSSGKRARAILKREPKSTSRKKSRQVELS